MWENSTGRSGPQTKDDCSTGCAVTGGLTTPHPGRTRSASSPGKADCEPSPTATRVSCQEHLEREPEPVVQHSSGWDKAQVSSAADSMAANPKRDCLGLSGPTDSLRALTNDCIIVSFSLSSSYHLLMVSVTDRIIS